MAIFESMTAKVVAAGALSAGAVGAGVAVSQAGEGINAETCTTLDARVSGQPIESAYSDAAVIEIQQALINSGAIDSILGGADGDFGAVSCTALGEFQKREGLVHDYKLGSQTAGALGLTLSALELKQIQAPTNDNISEDELYNAQPDDGRECGIDAVAVGDKQAPLSNEEVKLVQEALNELGVPTAVDGILGKQTKTNIVTGQLELGVLDDCNWGPVTQKAYELFTNGSEAEPSEESTQIVSPECTFSVISQAEVANLLGGSASCENIMAFQRDNGLTVDGVVGPQTAMALIRKSDNACALYGSNGVDDCALAVQKNGNLGQTFVVQDGSIIREMNSRFGNPDRGRQTPEGSFKIQRSIEGEHQSENCDVVCMWNSLYFDGGAALHGTKDPNSPNGSLACIGVPIGDSEFIYAQFKSGLIDRIVVIDFQRN